MNIHADIFDNLYPFIVIIFFIVSILSSIMKKKMKDSVQQQTKQDNAEEYEIKHEEKVKPQYDYYKATSGSYNVENILNKLQDKISNIESQKKQQKISKRKHVERAPLKPIETPEPTITHEENLFKLDMKEK